MPKLRPNDEIRAQARVKRGKGTGGKTAGAAIFLLALVSFSGMAQSQKANGTVLYLDEAVVRKSLKSHVDPEMPAAARQFHIYGDVSTQFTIGLDGKVESIDEAKGNQLLKASVATALKKWVFVPFTHDGAPVKVKTEITFAFKP